jgi:hypothetical protein
MQNMDHNPMDELFRSRLKDAEETPPMHLWEGINAASGSKKGGSWLIWVLAGGVLLAIVARLMVVEYYTGSTDTQHAEATTINAENGMPAATGPDASAANGSATAAVPSLANGGPSPSGLPATADAETNNTDTPATSGKPNPGANAESAPSSNSYNSTTGQNAPNKPFLNPGAPSVGNTTGGNGKGNGIGPGPEKGSTSTTAATSTAATTSGRNIKPEIDYGKANPQGSTSGGAAKVSRSGVTAGGTRSSDLAAQPSPAEQAQKRAAVSEMLEKGIPRGAGLLPESPLPAFRDTNATPQFPPHKATRSLKFTVGAYGTTALQSRMFGSTNADAFRQQTRIRPVAGAGALARLVIQPVGTISAGIEWSRFTEEQDFQSVQLTTTLQYDSVGVVYDSTGGYTVIYDTVAYTQYDTTAHMQSNSYTLISVPLMVGWQMEWRRFALGIEAGPVLHLVRKYSGNLYGTGTGQDPDATALDAYYTKWKLDLQASLRLEYALSNRWSVFGNFYGRFSPSKLGEDLPHRFVRAGFGVGITYTAGFHLKKISMPVQRFGVQ